MRITTNQPDTKSYPSPNPTTKHYVVVSIQLNIVTCPMCPEKFIWDNVIAPSLLLAFTLPIRRHSYPIANKTVRMCFLTKEHLTRFAKM